MLHICERGFKDPEMVQGEMCGLLVGASMALSAGGNYQVRTVYQLFGGHVFTEFFLELIAPPPPQNATTVKDARQTEKLLDLTEEEERELAELMGDDV
jgi:hypothetical protein